MLTSSAVKAIPLRFHFQIRSSGSIGRGWDLRKPHKQVPRWLFRLVLVGLACCLIPQFGPGQLPTVEQPLPFRLGAPQDVQPEPSPDRELAPSEVPPPNFPKFIDEPLLPTTPPIVLH